MFLKKSQANKLISGISGFKRNDPKGRPRRNLFTYFSTREGYKIVPKMEKHFLLFSLVNHLFNQDEYIKKTQQSYDIGKGLFFHRMASTFLNISGILKGMKFYTYQSNRLKKQRGELIHEKDSFEWIEPFQKNSYFEINGHKGVIGEDELRDLCYALLIKKQETNNVEDVIKQFFEKFKGADNIEIVKRDEILKPEYFPANYFNQSKIENIKEKILSRLDNICSCTGKKEKAYDKMREVMEFINYCLPADEKLKLKDYRRYLKMVRFWNREKDNIKREFDTKGWTKYFSSYFWTTRNLEEVYRITRKKNAELFKELKAAVEKMDEREFGKYQQINDTGDLASLRQLANDLGLKWEEKDWEEYSKQTKKQVTDTQKLTIMKQRVTSELKKKHGIENLNLRITIDSDKSRKAVFNRIAIPEGFVKKHILKMQQSEKVSKKIREANCKILLSEIYEKLSKDFSDAKDWNKTTQINSLYEKNKLIAFMVVHLMEQLSVSLDKPTGVNELNRKEVYFRITDKMSVKIPFSRYSSLTYAMSGTYLDIVNDYDFSGNDRKKPLLDRIDVIEKGRMEFIKDVLNFEKYLFDNKIIEKTKFTDIETHISFKEIVGELVSKKWDENTLTEIKNARNNALHGDIPTKLSFHKAKQLIDQLKK